MLNLARPSDPAWLARALAHLDDVLVDHAHCEKKAASTALSLVFKYPEHQALLVPLVRLVREELEHFEAVLAVLAARGIPLRHQVPSPYAAGLLRAVRSAEPVRLLDTLLCMALIEARSCERMKLLGDAVEDPLLVGLYHRLLASEARHHQAYVELAAYVVPEEEVRRRLLELAAHEAAVLAASPALPRLHG